METKEFVEKCFANFENISEEFKDNLVKDLDKVTKEAELDYKRKIVAELLERECMITKEKLAKLAPKIKREFNLFPLGTPNVRLSEVAIGMKNYEKHLIKYQYLEYSEHFWVLVSIVGGKLDVFHAKTMEECKKHLKERVDEQQYTDVICGDVTPEFVDEYLYLYGEK